MLDNYLNPLMLRELRQNVRNNITVFLINLFIGVLAFFCVAHIMLPINTNGTGKMLFASISAAAGLACFIVVVIFSFSQTSKQRKEDDLMFATALSPWSMIAGKWLSGAVMTFLLLSLSAPFIAVAYLLRGIDIQSILYFFINTFISIQLLNAAGISLASMTKTTGISAFFVFIGIFVLTYSVVGIITLPFVFAHGGGSVILPSWIFEALYTAILLILTLLFLLIGSAALSPPTSNRLLPVRIMMTAIFLISIAGVYFISCILSLTTSLPSSVHSSDLLGGWFFLWTALTILILFLTVHEQEQWCFRIRRTIPKNRLLRFLCFPFYTGSPCGIIWTVILFSAAAVVFGFASEGLSGNSNGFWAAVFLVLFAFDYCITAMLISSRFDPHRQMPVWGIVLTLLIIFTFGSFILAFLFFASSFDFLGNDFYTAYKCSPLSALNPFMLFENSGDIFIRWAGAAVWFIVLMPFFAVWFISRVRHFTPVDTDDAMTLEQAVEAVKQTEANV